MTSSGMNQSTGDQPQNKVQETFAPREFVTPEQDPAAIWGECLHRLRTSIADSARHAANPVTREHVLRDARDIQLAASELYKVVSFTLARLPEAAE